MKGEGQALSHGAVSILNAMATGKGGAMGIDLWTRAKVTLRDGRGEVSGFISSDRQESTKLIVSVLEKTLEHYGHESKVSGEVATWSNIPIAVGLKSSSAAANATALATASALGEDPDDDTLVTIGVDSSLECGVSLTGAFDDSFASYHGGTVITDNVRRKVERILETPENIQVLAFVPPRKTHTSRIDPSKFAPIRRLSELAYDLASDGRCWDALTINGLAYSAILGEDQRPALAALEAGALGAGLTGKGPAIVAVVEEESVDKVRRALGKFDGRVLESSPNKQKAAIEL